MKLNPRPYSYNGEQIAKDEFAFVHESTQPDKTAIVFHCRGTGRPRLCHVLIKRGVGGPLDTTLPNGNSSKVHGWDGNEQEPTLTPSIGCDQRCGWHGHIIKGEITP